MDMTYRVYALIRMYVFWFSTSPCQTLHLVLRGVFHIRLTLGRQRTAKWLAQKVDKIVIRVFYRNSSSTVAARDVGRL